MQQLKKEESGVGEMTIEEKKERNKLQHLQSITNVGPVPQPKPKPAPKPKPKPKPCTLKRLKDRSEQET